MTESEIMVHFLNQDPGKAHIVAVKYRTGCIQNISILYIATDMNTLMT